MSIKIPKCVTSIGGYAFRDCSSLKSIKLSEGITSIGEYAFAGCSSLTSTKIPNSVTSIGHGAFYSCTSLKSIELPEGITSIGEFTFQYCSSLESIEIPNSVTSVGEWAFYGCSSLTSIELPKSVTSIGVEAFYGCSSLTSIEIPSGVTSIRKGTFSNCTSLTSIKIPSSVTSIEKYAFDKGTTIHYKGSICEWRRNGLQLPDSIVVFEQDYHPEMIPEIIRTGSETDLGEVKYTCPDCGANYTISYYANKESAYVSGLPGYRGQHNGKVVLPASIDNKKVVAIRGGAFFKCSSLESIEIPNSVTFIGNDAFRGCSNLTSIEIPNSVTSIGDGAFRYCSNLTNIEIPNSVTSIGDLAFHGCSSLMSIKLPDNIKSIGTSAFNRCSSLESIEIPNSVTSIGEAAFYRCSSLESIEIPNSVTSIGGSAFYGCSSLESIEIPNSVTSIRNDVFYECRRLTSIKLPDNIKSIGKYAFYGCSSLENIEIPSSVASIGGSAFSSCDSLTSIELPESIKSIGSYAFYGCTDLTSILIPRSIVSIGINAMGMYYSKMIEQYQPIPEFVIYGIAGSAAETYANKNGITFVDKSVPVTGVSLNKFMAKIEAGKTLQLTVTVSPADATNKSVSWKSSNTKVATVDKNGKVTAIGAGSASITVTTNSGGKKATCKVTVTQPIKATKITLTKTNVAYTGSALQPRITIEARLNGKVITLKAGTHYTLAYKNNKNVGTATVTITGKGYFTGRVTKTFTIIPKATTLSTVTGISKSFTAKWTAQRTQTTGYQIQYSTSKTFKSGNKTATITKNTTTSKKITNLKAKATYYVRVRTYKTVGGKKYYSAWSKVKAVKTK